MAKRKVEDPEPKRKAEDPEPKRKVDMTDFFQPGKAPVPTLDGPKSLFESNDERRQKVTVMKSAGKGKPRKPVSVYVYDACRDGSLKGGCHETCPREWVDLMHFAPEDGSSQSQANHTNFVAAYDAYKAAHAQGDRTGCLKQLEILAKLRTGFCAKCRERMKKLSPAEQACKGWYNAARQAAAIQNDGCAHTDCPVRGPDVWQVLTADHGTNPKATHEIKNRTTGKVTTRTLNLGDYTFWPKMAGVPAMEAELAQIDKWICRCCHALESTSSQGRRCADPATMPEGKRRGTPLELKEYKARQNAVIVYPKQQHVDACKRAIGKCATCKRPVLPGTEPAFEFNHLVEATKCKGGLFRRRGGVSGLVGNNAKAAALDLVKHLLDAEMAKCELLCSNCHFRHTNKYGADDEEESE